MSNWVFILLWGISLKNLHIPEEDRPSKFQVDVHLCAPDRAAALRNLGSVETEGPLHDACVNNGSACSALKPRTRRLLISSVPLDSGGFVVTGWEQDCAVTSKSVISAK